jgi:hypothetical protein
MRAKNISLRGLRNLALNSLSAKVSWGLMLNLTHDAKWGSCSHEKDSPPPLKPCREGMALSI